MGKDMGKIKKNYAYTAIVNESVLSFYGVQQKFYPYIHTDIILDALGGRSNRQLVARVATKIEISRSGDPPTITVSVNWGLDFDNLLGPVDLYNLKPLEMELIKIAATSPLKISKDDYENGRYFRTNSISEAEKAHAKFVSILINY